MANNLGVEPNTAIQSLAFKNFISPKKGLDLSFSGLEIKYLILPKHSS
jgi:hypothetical protein